MIITTTKLVRNWENECITAEYHSDVSGLDLEIARNSAKSVKVAYAYHSGNFRYAVEVAFHVTTENGGYWTFARLVDFHSLDVATTQGAAAIRKLLTPMALEVLDNIPF